jgi:hypothetical protein
MSDPHDREPIDQATIDCWRIKYGLDKRTPADAAKWWHENMRGFAPSGCVAALGVALDELAALRQDAERYRWLLTHGAPMGLIDWGVLGLNNQDTNGLTAEIDAAIADARGIGAA